MASPRDILRFSAPPSDVRLASRRTDDLETRLREREQAGYERGRREGEQALSGQLLQQRQQLIELQNGVLGSLQQSVSQVIKDCETTLVSLALEVAQKLVAGIPISPEMVEAAVREALAKVEETTDFQIYLHPQDLELLKQVNSSLLDPGSVERVHFQSSSEVTRGGCLVKTPFGVVDARRENKLDVLRKSLQSA